MSGHFEIVAARETIAMQLFTMHQVETNFAAISAVGDNIQLRFKRGPPPVETLWEFLTPEDRLTWRKRASALLKEASE